MLADILVFIFVLFFVYAGYKKGLIKTLYGLVSYFLAIALSVVLYPYVTDLISDIPFIHNAVSNVVDKLAATNFSEQTNPLVEYIFPSVDNAVTAVVINIISFVTVLILSRLIIGIFSKCLNIFSKLPIISTLNRLGGAIVGGIKGVILLYILFLIILLVPELGNGKVVESINSSRIANKFYTENIIIDILGKDIFSLNGK